MRVCMIAQVFSKCNRCFTCLSGYGHSVFRSEPTHEYITEQTASGPEEEEAAAMGQRRRRREYIFTRKQAEERVNQRGG